MNPPTPKLLGPKATEQARYKLWERIHELSHKDPPLKPLAEELRKLWLKAVEESKAGDLDRARRKDKGQVLWEVFSPSTRKPPFSIFHGQRIVTRTPNTIKVISEYCSAEERKKVLPEPSSEGSAWLELDCHWHREALNLDDFRAWAAYVDESVRRQYRLRDWEVKTKSTWGNTEIHQVRCETAAEATARVSRWTSYDITSVEEAA